MMSHHTATKSADMTITEKLLLQTLAGHFAWLESAHPRKARSAVVRKAKQCVLAKLRTCGRTRLAA